MTQGNQRRLNIHHQQQRGYHRGANHSHTKDTWDPVDFSTHHIELLWKKAQCVKVAQLPRLAGTYCCGLSHHQYYQQLAVESCKSIYLKFKRISSFIVGIVQQMCKLQEYISL